MRQKTVLKPPSALDNASKMIQMDTRIQWLNNNSPWCIYWTALSSDCDYFGLSVKLTPRFTGRLFWRPKHGTEVIAYFDTCCVA
jgi:hypothetical protein